MQISIVDSNAMPWLNGLDAIAAMAPEWRANLGPAEELADAYRRLNIKPLRVDPETGARIEVLRADPGYADVTDAYHDTVEECYCTQGSVVLSGEDTMREGTYFWRPPGFIHGADSEEGFSALIMCEGVSPSDGSGPVTRRIRPRSEAGTNALTTDPEKAMGPRGFVHHIRTSMLPWIPGPSFARGQGELAGYDLEHAEFKLLSHNAVTGAQSLLVRLSPGYAQAGRHVHDAAQQFFVFSGSLRWDGRELGQGFYAYRPAGAEAGPLESPEGALLFMKTDAWLDWLPVSEPSG